VSISGSLNPAARARSARRLRRPIFISSINRRGGIVLSGSLTAALESAQPRYNLLPRQQRTSRLVCCSFREPGLVPRLVGKIDRERADAPKDSVCQER
jgi:hypothetical protein